VNKKEIIIQVTHSKNSQDLNEYKMKQQSEKHCCWHCNLQRYYIWNW